MARIKKIIVRSILFFLAVVLVAVLWIALQFAIPGSKIVVSKETTHLVTPLDDDGLPDYAGYLLAKRKKGVTPKNNAAIPLLRATWPAGIAPEHQQLLCDELGIELITEPGLTNPYEALEGELQTWVEKLVPESTSMDDVWHELASKSPAWSDALSGPLLSQPWKGSDYPMVARWIEQHEKSIDLLLESEKLSEFYFPSPSMLVAPHDPIVFFDEPEMDVRRLAATCLELRALKSIGEGRLREAWQDAKAIHRFGSRIKHCTSASKLTSYGCTSFADSVVMHLLESPHIDISLANEIGEFYQTVPLHDDLAELYNNEMRYELLTSLISFSGQRSPDSEEVSDVLAEGNILEKSSLDWNAILRFGNEWRDKMVEMGESHGLKRDECIEGLNKDHRALQLFAPERYVYAALSRASRSRFIAEQHVRTLCGFHELHPTAEMRINSLTQLFPATAAIVGYRVENGVYPESIDQLLPKYLDKLPIDRAYGKPLAYRRTKDGFLLYSLGPNGKDDGGSLSHYLCYFHGYLVFSGADFRNEPALDLLGAEVDFANVTPELEAKHVIDDIPKEADDRALRFPIPKVTPPWIKDLAEYEKALAKEQKEQRDSNANRLEPENSQP